MLVHSVVGFEYVLDASRVDDLRARLARTRWPDQLPASAWRYGTDLQKLMQLCEYWRTDFDWQRFERRCNIFPQFTTEIDGQSLHFIHARSAERAARPLL